MRSRLTLPVAALAAGCALPLSGGTALAQSPPPCAPEATLQPSIAKAEDALDETTRAVATHPVTVNFEFARAANGSNPSFDQVRVAGPSGVIVKSDESDFTVTAPTAGAVPLSLTWVQGGSSQCTGTGQVTLTLVAAKPALVSFKQDFTGGGGTAWRGLFAGTIRRGRGGDATPVHLVVRASRRGTLRPPHSGRALLNALVAMGAPASGVLDPERVEVGIKRQNAVTALNFSGSAGRYQLFAQARFPTQLVSRFRMKFGLAIDVIQSGRRIGGMSSGLSCRERRSGGFIKGFSCRASGFRKQP